MTTQPLSLPRVLIVMVTKDHVHPKCMASVLSQDYKNYSTLIHVMKPRKTHKNKFMEQSMNVAENKELARKMALGSDAEYFFFVDSDIVLPKNATSELVLQLTAKKADPKLVRYVEKSLKVKCVYKQKHAIAGYYPLKDDKAEWIAGRFIADNLITRLRKVEPSVNRIDFAGLGCMMVSRALLEKAQIRDGTDKFVKTSDGQVVFLDDSLDFCNQIFELGHQLWADGSVVCKHLKQ